MLDSARLQIEARYNEKVAEKRFKKMGYSVTWLDVQGPRKRPEFLVSDTKGPVLLCEVKTIFSAGFLPERGAHISSHDPALLDTGVFGWSTDFEAIYRCYENAICKCKVLWEDEPHLLGLPLLVVLFFDAFANAFSMIPAIQAQYPELSGIAQVESDAELRVALDKCSLDELKELIGRGSMKGLPPPSKDFRVVPNPMASSPLPSSFLEACLTWSD